MYIYIYPPQASSANFEQMKFANSSVYSADSRKDWPPDLGPTEAVLGSGRPFQYSIFMFSISWCYNWTKLHSNSSRWIPLFVHHDESRLFCGFFEFLPLCLGHVVFQRRDPTPQFRPQPGECERFCLGSEHCQYYKTELPASFPANSWVLVIDVHSIPSNLVSS